MAAVFSRSPRWRRSARRHLEGYLFISPALLGLALWAAGPTASAFYLSLTRYDLFSAPVWYGLGNYARLLNDPLFWQSLRVTLTYSGLVVPLSMVIGLALALLLQQRLKGISLFRVAFYLPSTIPVVATTVLWIWLLDPQFGAVNALLATVHLPRGLWLSDPSTALPSLIVMGLWSVGGPALIYLAGLQAISPHYYEAARIDGAGRLAQLRHITLPLLSPTLLYTVVLGIIGSLHYFTQAYIAGGAEPGAPLNSTLFMTLYIYQAAFNWTQMGYACAMAWVLFAIILALTLLVFRSSRYWVYYDGAER